MDKIKVLEEIGLKRVSDETHIEQKYLKFMVDNDYDKLDYINTLGFVRILSREYKIDLSAWTEAFEEYWIQNRKDKEDNGLFIVVNDEKKSKRFLAFMVIILLGVTLSILFSLFQEKIGIPNYVNNNESSYENTTVIEEVQQSLVEVNSSLKQSELQETVLDETNSSEETVSIDETNSSEKIVSTDETIAEEITEEAPNEEPIKEKKTEVKELIEPREKVSPRFSQEAVVIPNSELWLGIIYLDTKERKSFLGEGNFSVDISREQIITTGHGSFNLSMNGKIRKFNRQAPMRFWVKDLNLTEIDWSKFKELNEGKSW